MEDDTISTRLELNNTYEDDLNNFNIMDTTTKVTTEFDQDFEEADDDDGESDVELDRTSKNNRNRRLNESTINRIQAMAISDDDEYGKCVL